MSDDRGRGVISAGLAPASQRTLAGRYLAGDG